MTKPKWLTDLELMLSEEKGRGYITPKGLSVYVRVTTRRIKDNDDGLVGPRVRTLEIANVNATKIGQGCFSRWLPKFEALADKNNRVVYVENVQTVRFRKFFTKRGYIPCDTGQTDPIYPVSFWRKSR